VDAVTSPIRHTVWDRMPMYRRIYQPAPRRSLPVWLRRLLWALLLLVLLLLALVACHESEKPASLDGAALVGPRLTTGPVCVEEAVDVSGSMLAYTAQRERAERELFAFARRELAPDDSLSAAFFSSTAVVALAPSPLAQLSSAPVVPPELIGGGTLLVPAVEGLVAARPADAQCAVRALVVITDGLLGDSPAALSAALTAANYHRVYAVIPADSGWQLPALGGSGLDERIIVKHFHDGGWGGRVASVVKDAKPLDVALGHIFAELTGQQLVKAEPTSTAGRPTG
jgi:hypothetical protein